MLIETKAKLLICNAISQSAGRKAVLSGGIQLVSFEEIRGTGCLIKMLESLDNDNIILPVSAIDETLNLRIV